MAHIIEIGEKSPKIAPTCWLAPNATVVGDVEISDDCSIWFSAVIRGDVCSIRIGPKTNIQDGAIIHGTYKKSNTVIGSEVSVGHGAVLHGCNIHDRVLVGMKAVVMDHAIVESNVLIAAGAIVLEHAHLKSGYIYAGVPAKPIKKLDQNQSRFHIKRTADAYLLYSSWYI